MAELMDHGKTVTTDPWILIPSHFVQAIFNVSFGIFAAQRIKVAGGNHPLMQVSHTGFAEKIP